MAVYILKVSGEPYVRIGWTKYISALYTAMLEAWEKSKDA